jgi:hypothetical protein
MSRCACTRSTIYLLDYFTSLESVGTSQAAHPSSRS